MVRWTGQDPTTHPCQMVALRENIVPPHIDSVHNFDLDRVCEGVSSHHWWCDAVLRTSCGRACEDQ